MRPVIRQAVRFLLVGGVNTVVGLLTIYALMFFLSMPPLLANVLGYALGLIVSYTLNKAWTFESRGDMKSSARRYVAAAALCYLLNFSIVFAFTHGLQLNPYLAQLLGIGAYSVAMFVACRMYVFPQEQA